MTFYQMMRQGRKIKIEPGTAETKDYSPAEFWTVGKTIYCAAAVLGNNARRDDLNAAVINKHIEQAIKEGFKVTIAA